MVFFGALHLLAGFLIGARFRFGALLPAFAVVAIETVATVFAPNSPAWYIVLMVGLAALQVGYVAAMFVRPAEAPSSQPQDASPYRGKLHSR